MDASDKSVSLNNIDLSGDRMLKMNMRKARGKYGNLKIYKLCTFELKQVISVLESLPSDLLNNGNTKSIIF